MASKSLRSMPFRRRTGGASEEEVSDLKGLLGYYLERELDTLAKEGVRLKLIGDYRAFGPDLVAAARARDRAHCGQ